MLVPAVALFVVAASQVAPASANHLWDVCQDRSPANPPDDRIAACTAVIGDVHLGSMNRAFALVMRGNAYLYGRHDYDRAFDDFNASINIDEEGGGLIGRSDVYRRRGEFSSAVADLTRAIELEPTWDVPYRKRGVIYSHDLHDYEKAIADYTQAIHLESTSAVTYMGRALAYVRGPHDYLRALDDYNEAIRLAPGDADAVFDRGLVYFRQADYSHALADFETDLRLRPDDAPGLIMRGQTLGYLHRFEEAVADIDRGAALAPSVAHDEDRCWVRGFSNRDLDTAVSICESVLRRQPNDTSVLVDRAMIEIRRERWQNAWSGLDAAARIEEGAVVLFLRGVCARHLGRRQEGDADITRATTLRPDVVSFYASFGIAP